MRLPLSLVLNLLQTSQGQIMGEFLIQRLIGVVILVLIQGFNETKAQTAPPAQTNLKAFTLTLSAPADPSKCTNLKVPGYVLAVNTRNLCLSLHTGKDCTGNQTEIMPRSPLHTNLMYWGIKSKIASMGPCRPGCDEAVTGKAPDVGVGANLTIYSKPNFKGAYRKLKVKGCTPIPMQFTRQLLSVKTNGECFQIYNNIDCKHNGTGVDSIELRKGTPMHNHLYYWLMKETKAVSHCSYKCVIHEEKKTGRDLSFDVAANQVLLFSEPHFKGFNRSFTVKECTDLNDNWEGTAMSLVTSKDSCFMLYEMPECNAREMGESLKVTGWVEDLTVNKFDSLARSIKQC